MARGPGRPRKNGSAEEPPTPSPDIGDNSRKQTPSPNIIAVALAEITALDVQMASIAGRKGAAINRYEVQGVDRKVLRGLATLARGNPEEAAAYIQSLTKYAVAAQVVSVADPAWSASVKQAEMFMTADGETAENLRRVRAHKQGFAAGKKGHHIQSSPYQNKVGSPEFVGWRDGHVEGMEVRAMIKPGAENITEAPNSKTRREPPKRGSSGPNGAAADEAAELGAAVSKELSEQDAASVH